MFTKRETSTTKADGCCHCRRKGCQERSISSSTPASWFLLASSLFMLVKYKTYVRSCAIVLLQTVYDSWGLLSPCMHGSIIYFTYVYSVLCNYIYTAAYFRSETKVYTITTGIPTFVVCQRHTVKALIHTAKRLSCGAHGKQHTVGIGKEGLCRESFFEYSAKSLPCVKLDKKISK